MNITSHRQHWDRKHHDIMDRLTHVQSSISAARARIKDASDGEPLGERAFNAAQARLSSLKREESELIERASRHEGSLPKLAYPGRNMI